MALFRRKKEKEVRKVEELPEPPRFPEMKEIKEAIRPSPVIPPITAAPITRLPEIKIAKLPEEKGGLIPSLMAPSAALPAIPAVPRLVRAREIEPVTEPVTKSREPVFVKIDKFESALSAFEEIKRRLEESFELLEKIKKARAKEKEEIDAWEKEIEGIRENIKELDEKLFGKVEV